MADPIAPGAGTEAPAEFDESKLPKFSELDPANLTPEQAQEVITSAQALLGQTKHWRGKAVDSSTGKTYAEILAAERANAKPTPPATPETPPDVNVRISKLESVEEKRHFGHANQLTPEETDHLFAYASGLGIKPSEALKNTFFQTALEASRQASNNDNATPGPSGRAPKVEGKTFEKMSTEERRNNFGAIVKASSKK